MKKYLVHRGNNTMSNPIKKYIEIITTPTIFVVVFYTFLVTTFTAWKKSKNCWFVHKGARFIFMSMWIFVCLLTMVQFLLCHCSVLNLLLLFWILLYLCGLWHTRLRPAEMYCSLQADAGYIWEMSHENGRLFQVCLGGAEETGRSAERGGGDREGQQCPVHGPTGHGEGAGPAVQGTHQPRDAGQALNFIRLLRFKAEFQTLPGSPHAVVWPRFPSVVDVPGVKFSANACR